MSSNRKGNEMRTQINILGAPVDGVSLPETMAHLEDFIQTGCCHQVVTANPEIIDHATRHPEMMQLLQRADLVTADGYGVCLAARILGKKLPERVTGIELAEAICAESGARGWRIFLLGSEPGVAQEAAARIRRRYPDVRIAGVQHGYFRGGGEDAVIEAIAASQADILLAGLGSPYQEQFVARYQWEMNVPVAIGVGGSFDVLSGRVKRAPGIFQRLRLEWLYRIATDPKRWRRALALPRFVGKVLWQRMTTIS